MREDQRLEHLFQFDQWERDQRLKHIRGKLKTAAIDGGNNKLIIIKEYHLRWYGHIHRRQNTSKYVKLKGLGVQKLGEKGKTSIDRKGSKREKHVRIMVKKSLDLNRAEWKSETNKGNPQIWDKAMLRVRLIIN